MASIKIYTQMLCPYCSRAKTLLGRKGAAIDEIDITGNQALRAEMMQASNGARTVPQIFIGDTHVGGCDDLMAMERAGKLDALLAG